MKRIGLAGLLAVAVLVPLGAQADDIPDGAACQAGTADPVTLGSEPDRGAVCVHAYGTTVFYIGGEAQAEEEGDPAFGGACGAIIVMDEEVAGDPDWDNAGADGEVGTADDEHCD